MITRPMLAARPIALVGSLVAGLSSACTDELRLPGVLTDEPVVMGISLSVIEDGPYAADLAPLPADRPRAEVLPLDTVELDALIANVDGPIELDDAAWVLCGDPCLGSLELQGERYGALEPCAVDSAERSFACLAGRGARPRVVMPALVTDWYRPVVTGAYAFVRAAVITGNPGGPSTDECLQQLVTGPRRDLWGCAIGVRELPYGPPWALQELVAELESDPWVLEGLLQELAAGHADDPPLPSLVTELLPPNAAPKIEEVRFGTRDALIYPDLGVVESRSIHEPIEIRPGAELAIDPVVSARDQQLLLTSTGPDSWVGTQEGAFFQAWTDVPLGRSFGVYGGSAFSWYIQLTAPEVEGPVRLYVVVTDSRNGISWFTLELQVVAE